MKRKSFHRPAAMKLEHRAKIFHWRTMGVTFPKIAQQLGISRPTANRDYAIAKKEFDEYWKASEVENRNKFLQGILAVAQEAWENYLAIKTELARINNPSTFAKTRLDKNLYLVLKAYKDARDLLGVDVPKRVVLSGDVAQERTRFLEMINGIHGSIEGPPIDMGLIEAKDVEKTGGNGKVNGEGKEDAR